jgi:hypothetical protein
MRRVRVAWFLWVDGVPGVCPLIFIYFFEPGEWCMVLLAPRWDANADNTGVIGYQSKN